MLWLNAMYMDILNLLIHNTVYRSQSSVSSTERKYQKPCDYIDKVPKQEIRAKEIQICFPENKELEATETKHQVVFSFIENVQISPGNQHIFKASR